MAFNKNNKKISKIVSVGAYQVIFNDNENNVQISYSEYEDDKPVAFLKNISVSFDELKEQDLEGFNSVMAYIKDLTDSQNPTNNSN